MTVIFIKHLDENRGHFVTFLKDDNENIICGLHIRMIPENRGNFVTFRKDDNENIICGLHIRVIPGITQ